MGAFFHDENQSTVRRRKAVKEIRVVKVELNRLASY
jgi:hypothetical protein